MWSHNFRVTHVRRSLIAATMGLLTITLTAHATLPEWLQHVVGVSTIEAALYRGMALPSVQAMYPRPPKEAQGELARLIAGTPDDGQLYALRARTDESALDFTVAEADWKLFVAHAKDPADARLQLADYYHRRLMTAPELATLKDVGAAPPVASERFVDPAQQRSWRAFERMLALIAEQGLPPAEVTATFQAFLARYPDQPAVYARFLTWQLANKQWTEAAGLIARYRKAFPQDEVFPIRAQALLEYRRGNVEQALAVYDRAFQPLWPAQLIQAYFSLLDATHSQRAFVADARARLAAHPDGPEALNALARIFYYDQQAGRLDKAQQTVDAFRIAREARNGGWTAQDLATLAALTDSTHSYAESARYDYALASTAGNLPSGEPAAQAGLSALAHLLLTAPDQPLALGAGNLTLYRDIATLDQGPGYWNGILSLWLNGTSPEQQYQTETARAQSYFHRAKAAELLAELDARFPAAPERAGLHAELVRTYAGYGESDAVIAAGKEFLATFTTSPDRVEIGGLIADAYARQKNTAAEFALYDSLLTELAAKTDGLPLTAGNPAAPVARPEEFTPGTLVNPDAETDSPQAAAANRTVAAMRAASYDLTSYTPHSAVIPEAVEYARILDRCIARLVAEQQIPQALTVLRHQLDRNPNEPLLYERLATFLQQNNLYQQEEETYKLAVAHFQSPGWYDKLARFYLRGRSRESYNALTRQVVDIFNGTDLDAYFRQMGTLSTFDSAPQAALGEQLAVQLNLYAQKRFPHDLVFTRNLLRLYQSPRTMNRAAYDDLLRHHWWEADDLRSDFFASLSRTGKLQSELAALGPAPSNPAATRELAEIDIWASHFEAAAPLMGAVADQYPADPTTGDQTISLYRSLAYLDPTAASTKRAAAVEARLIQADPGDADRLATMGDLYAEATSTGGEDIAVAAPSWRRIPTLHPGTPAGFLTSATIFWDYFQFDDALAELTAARTRFHQPALFGYEAGAIEENRHDMPAAIAEYTTVATAPPDTAFFNDSLNAALGALFAPPSDAADSNLRATTQSLFNSAAARDRLLQLATRPATRALVDTASAKAVAAASTPATLTLRADILIAQKRQPELAPLLEQALAKATTVDEAAAIGDLARAHSQSSPASEAQLREVTVTPGPAVTDVDRSYARAGSYGLTTVYEHALERQIALTPDPVQKIELSYTLSSTLEEQKDIPGAAKVIDGVYRDNPRILGVVRATTDFYARTSQPPRAIATLLAASKVATPDYARSFTLEAAQKANDAGDTAQARTLAESLLEKTPYDATVLGIIAASYARANDDAGLKAFYLARLAAVKSAKLSPEDRKADTALLRRGLIPALTRTKDYEGAVAQYIALLSAYPEDSATAQEAALYSLRWNRQNQLLDFLRTTVKQSPRDSRFAILLAQVDTTLDDFPAAVAAYTQAIAIRKDRADLYSARVDLELRLGLNEQAADDFNRLYILSYKDPSWMVKLAELRARQQRPADAVKALETAYITGQPAGAANCFLVSSQLAKWNLLAQAQTFAEQGVKLAGTNLLTAANAGSAANYARVLARLGKPDEAITTLIAAYRAIEPDQPLPAAMAEQYAQTGVSAADIARDTRSYNDTRRQTARAQLDQAVGAIGEVVQTFYTPEQKVAYQQTLEKLHGLNDAWALVAATSAGLAELEAEWRKQALLNGPLPQDPNTYASLERRRFQFVELGNTLELYANRVPRNQHNGILHLAAEAYRDGGDEADEMRVERPLVLALDTGLRDRYLDLLLRHDRTALVALAANRDDGLADAAANYAVAHATQAQALAAVSARARSMPPVWRPATASLVLTNFASPTATAPNIADFTQSLNSDATIATRLATKADTAHQLTGPNWFYYAGRFGLFLNTVPKAPALPDAADFLPAELEYNPGDPVVYLHLARNDADAANYTASAAEYRHAIELAPNNPAVHDEFAVVLDRGGHREDALAEWRTALGLMVKRQSGEVFFSAFKSILFHLGQRSLTATFRPEIEAVLKPYFARNGNYRSNELLEAIYKASATPAVGISFVLDAANFASGPNLLLEDLRNAQWIAPAARETILLRQIQLERNKPDGTQDSSPQGMRGYQMDLVRFYLDRNEVPKADQVMGTVAAQPGYNTDTDRIIIAARLGHLQSLLDRWRDQPDTTPTDGEFGSALYYLRRPTPSYHPDPAVIRPLEEFVFQSKEVRHSLQPTDFLALAQLRIETNDLSGAVDMLHRLSLHAVSTYENGAIQFHGDETMHDAFGPAQIQYRGDDPPNPYANVDYAASLLETTHHDAEAIPFLTTLVQSVPWNASYRLRLAEAEQKSGDAAKSAELLIGVARDASAPYATRTQAAKDLPMPTDPGSAELTLLAGNAHPAPAAARQPYFVAAREAAAVSAAKPDKAALLREAIAIAPNAPSADQARLDLLLTQTAADPASGTLAMYAALASAQPTYNQQFDQQQGSESESSDATAGPPAPPEDPTDAFDHGGVQGAELPFALAHTLDRPTQIRLAVLLASACQRMQIPAQSLVFDQLAVNIDAQNPRPDPVVVKRLTDYQGALALEKKNALRRPLIHNDLDQTNQVRPRLTLATQARAEAP